MEFHYGLQNNKRSIYNWAGNLAFLEEEEVILPLPCWKGLKKNQAFAVLAKRPNHQKDENSQNNILTSTVSLPKELPREFTLYVHTNNVNRAQENSFTLSDAKGRVLFAEDDFKDSIEYHFPIKLNNGIYQFLFKDNMEDGISRHWWYRNSAPEKGWINGQIRFLTAVGDTLHEFNPDFGQELLFNFHVGKIP